MLSFRTLGISLVAMALHASAYPSTFGTEDFQVRDTPRPAADVTMQARKWQLFQGDPNIKDVTQGVKLKDSWLAAASSIIAVKDPAKLKEIIIEADPNAITDKANVTLHLIQHDPLTFMVKKPTKKQLIGKKTGAFFREGEEPAVWNAVLEEGMKELYDVQQKAPGSDPYQQKLYGIEKELNGGYASGALFAIYGEQTQLSMLNETSQASLIEMMGTDKLATTTSHQEATDVPKDMTFAVMGYDQQEQRVVLHSPQGKVKENSNIKNHEEAGTFDIGIDAYQKNFLYIEYLDRKL